MGCFRALVFVFYGSITLGLTYLVLILFLGRPEWFHPELLPTVFVWGFIQGTVSLVLWEKSRTAGIILRELVFPGVVCVLGATVGLAVVVSWRFFFQDDLLGRTALITTLIFIGGGVATHIFGFLIHPKSGEDVPPPNF